MKFKATGINMAAFAITCPQNPAKPPTRTKAGRGKRGRKTKVIAKVPAKSLKFIALVKYCEQKGWPVPVPEHRFDSVRKFRFDGAFVERKLAIEIHGSVFTQGRHTRGKGFSTDQEKWALAALAGWRILPVTTAQFDAGLLFQYLDREFATDSPT